MLTKKSLNKNQDFELNDLVEFERSNGKYIIIVQIKNIENNFVRSLKNHSNWKNFIQLDLTQLRLNGMNELNQME
jgi:hypothetical protein